MQFWIGTPPRLDRLSTSLLWHRHPTVALRTFAQVQPCSSVSESSKDIFSPPRSVRWHSFNSSQSIPNQTLPNPQSGQKRDAGTNYRKREDCHQVAVLAPISIAECYFRVLNSVSSACRRQKYMRIYDCISVRILDQFQWNSFCLFRARISKKKYVEIELLSDPSVRGVSTMLVHRTQRHATSNATTISLSPPYYALFQVLFVTNIFESKTAIVNERTYPARCS